jgi:hypothetical protein
MHFLQEKHLEHWKKDTQLQRATLQTMPTQFI